MISATITPTRPLGICLNSHSPPRGSHRCSFFAFPQIRQTQLLPRRFLLRVNQSPLVDHILKSWHLAINEKRKEGSTMVRGKQKSVRLSPDERLLLDTIRQYLNAISETEAGLVGISTLGERPHRQSVVPPPLTRWTSRVAACTAGTNPPATTTPSCLPTTPGSPSPDRTSGAPRHTPGRWPGPPGPRTSSV